MRINCAGESGIVYRILIVDDEKIERTGLRLLLGKMDQKFEITEAVNGKEALEWLSCNRADILVTDIARLQESHSSASFPFTASVISNF